MFNCELESWWFFRINVRETKIGQWESKGILAETRVMVLLRKRII